MLFLHRGCFAEAMAYPNPLRSPYAPSVQAAYKSACIVLADTQEHYAKNPMLLSRVWRIWSNAFSAAVRYCSSKTLNIAPDCGTVGRGWYRRPQRGPTLGHARPL